MIKNILMSSIQVDKDTECSHLFTFQLYPRFSRHHLDDQIFTHSRFVNQVSVAWLSDLSRSLRYLSPQASSQILRLALIPNHSELLLKIQFYTLLILHQVIISYTE